MWSPAQPEDEPTLNPMSTLAGAPKCRYGAKPIRHSVRVSGAPDLGGIKRRYARARRIERLFGRRHDLANDAMLVVLEWGPPMRLPEEWRLEQRQPTESDSRRQEALAEAHVVRHAAYELTAPAWPLDRREVPSEVDRHAAIARQELAARHPYLSAHLLARAVSQANYTHAK
jgi:hypothetical protein